MGDLMKVVLLRVGIDSGCGGIQGPLFKDGTFEFIPIPRKCSIDDQTKVSSNEELTYGTLTGRHGRPLIDYFPRSRQLKMMNKPIHLDPEFETYTYGDPTIPKVSLKRLLERDILIFYCGLEGWGFKCEPALYIIGYFEVLKAGIAKEFEHQVIQDLFSNNAHVMHKNLFEEQKDRLVLVKGNSDSRILNKAVLISTMGQDRSGKPLKILSPEMRKIFGDFNGKISFQRSPPRWVDPLFVDSAAKFVRSLD
jgi:hypothetical protein